MRFAVCNLRGDELGELPAARIEELIEDEYGIRFTAKIDRDQMAWLMHAMLGGPPARRSWWHRFLIRLGFPHSGPYVHTFS